MSDERSYLSSAVDEKISDLSGKTDGLAGKVNELSEKTDSLETYAGVEYAVKYEDVSDKVETVQGKWLDMDGNLQDGGGKTTGFLIKDDAESLYFTGSSDPYGGPRIVVAYGSDKKIVRTPDGKPASYGMNTKLFRFPLSRESILNITGGTDYSYVRVCSYDPKHFKLERAAQTERIRVKSVLDGYPRAVSALDFSVDNEYLNHLGTT